MTAGTRSKTLKRALAALSLAAAGASFVVAQEAPQQPATQVQLAVEPKAVPACASDPDKLGIERVVEIDTAGGGVYGSAHPHNNFLKDKEVVLTFDDGPMRAYTRRVLAALDAHCTRATFFMVGRMAAADPAMVKEVIAAGHTVGTHTYAHKNLKPLGLLKGRSDFEMGLSAVTKAADQPVAPFFRFPYLSESRQVSEYLKTRDMATFFIDVDSKDFQTRNSSIVFNRIMSQLAVTKKGIILMHDIQPSTAGMIRQLLDALHDKGYKVVHIVPKSHAATIAGYDGPASKAIAANDDKLKQQPLASRSVVWTMDPGSAKAAAPKKSTQTGSIAPASEAGDATPKSSEGLPWSKPVPAKAASNAPVKRPSPQKRDQEELPWQARVFAN